jgi:TctA family transporter
MKIGKVKNIKRDLSKFLTIITMTIAVLLGITIGTVITMLFGASHTEGILDIYNISFYIYITLGIVILPSLYARFNISS